MSPFRFYTSHCKSTLKRRATADRVGKTKHKEHQHQAETERKEINLKKKMYGPCDSLRHDRIEKAHNEKE